ncbi:MAG: B12-binding domain-containing radical SAM protein [Thermoplasmata archaeon]|nr:MAG: B12-binding domain-containing radical SAM protein [Thermoplasmata archaeon]
MKILLVNPPIPATWYNDEYYLPSSLLYLSAVLRENGDQVKILDMKALKPDVSVNHQKFYENALIDKISHFQPEIIGFGCLFSGNFPDVLRFSILCKQSFENIPIVAGGIHFTIYAREILANCLSIDWITLGEAEHSITQLVNTIKSNRYELDKVDGFVYRTNGKIVVNPKKSYIENIDDIPFPEYDLVNLEDYYLDTSRWHNPKQLPINTSIPIITSRSCPNRCSFCSMYMVMGPRWRARSPQNVLDEIEYVYDTYNHRHFSFMDDNLTLKKSRILEICNLIKKRKLNIQFETPNGLNLNALDEEVLDALVSAGLVRTYLAIESGSDFIRNKVMRKSLSREKIFEIVHLTKKYKQLFVNAFFIIGMPEETKETLAETYKMIQQIDVDKIQLQHIVPFPGTDVYDQALRDNLLVGIEPENLYKSDDLYFKNRNRFFIKPYKLDLEELHEFRAKCETLIAGQRADRIRPQEACSA